MRLHNYSKGPGPTHVWGALLFLIGVVLTGFHIIHFTDESGVIPVFIGIAIPFAISALWLIPLGVALILNDRIRTQVRGETLETVGPWIGVWTIVGIVWMSIAGFGSIMYQVAEGVTHEHAPYLMMMFATYGVIPGSLTGFFYGNAVSEAARVNNRDMQLKILTRLLRHNFRNDMNVITGNASMIAGISSDETVLDSVENIKRSASDLMSSVEKERLLVNVLLSEETDCDCEASLVEVTEAAANHAQSERIGATIEVVSDDCDIRVATHSYLERAVMELFENAVVHCDIDDPVIRVELSKTDEHGVISIFDPGAGIDSDELDAIYGETSDSELEHGSGVGLWLVDAIVTHRSGGEISYSAEEDQEADVVVRLPLA